MKIKITISLIWTVIVLCAFYFGRLARDYPAERQIVAQQKALARIPTIKEIQRKVGAEPDGIVGPNTIELWDKKTCDQYAVESFERMAGDTK